MTHSTEEDSDRELDNLGRGGNGAGDELARALATNRDDIKRRKG